MNTLQRTAPLTRGEWSALVRRLERLDEALAFGFGQEHVTYLLWRDLARELVLALEYYHERDDAARGALDGGVPHADD